jgi:23S rRNA pseudouridine2605 synthase
MPKAHSPTGLDRVLSKLGYCSRSQAAILIREGRVSLNGRPVTNPETPVRRDQDRVCVDGAAVRQAPPIYIAMNKPRGVVTTAADEQGRATVFDLLKPGAPWMGPVGRLDKASEGLLLLTNDSEWASRVTDPGRHLEKNYHVQIDRVAGASLLAQITRGGTRVQNCLAKADAEDLRAKRARVLRSGEKNSWLEIVLEEGKNRHIRRLLDGLGIGVLRLVRVSIGPLELGNLKKGATRRLSPQEKRAMDKALKQ